MHVPATARKLVEIAWHMLTRNEPYRYALPKSTQAKLGRVRIQAGGARKKGGYARGSARPATYGTGAATRGIPSLDQVYAAEQLPPAAELAPGECKMVAAHSLTEFVRDIHTPKRVPRRTKQNTH